MTGARFPAGAGIFFSSPPRSDYKKGSEGLPPGVERLEHEANHSPPSSAETNNGWSYASTPQHVFIAWYLVKHRDNFALLS